MTIEMIKDGFHKGLVSVVDSPCGDGTVCSIGGSWFYFGGQSAEEMTAKEYLANVPEQDIAREIYDTLQEFERDEAFRDEFRYYDAYLSERLGGNSVCRVP